MLPMSLFGDDQIRFDLLRKYSINQWGRYPNDVIPLTAADPDFRAAEEIRKAIVDMSVDGVFSYGGAVETPNSGYPVQGTSPIGRR